MNKKHILENKKGLFVSLALIIILGLAIYANSLGGQFIWDDELLVRDNAYIRDWTNMRNIFTKDIGSGAGRAFKPYRPLQIFTYAIDYSLWGPGVRGYHLTNAILHILVALALYWFINTLYADRLISLFTSIFYLVHPVHVEAVSFISGRADPLAALFMLLCFIFYIKHIDSKRISLYLCMAASYILAVFSRESSLILPLLLLLYHYAFKKRINLKGFLSLVGIAILFILVRYNIFKCAVFPEAGTSTVLQRVPGFFAALTEYIRILFLPLNLHTGYGDRLFNLLNPKAIIGVIILAFLSLYLFYAAGTKKRDPKDMIFFGVSWFLITLLPQSNLYYISAYMAEHWLYIPSIGFFLILARFLSRACRIEKLKVLTAVFIIGLLGFYSYLTIKQNDYWREPIAFYERTLRYAPDNPKLCINLGNLYRNTGRKEEAEFLFERAIEINPHDAIAHNNLGNIYSELGKNTAAIASYNKAIAIDPRYAKAHHSLG
ncbi:tetratricopeptide repeat protein, partial [Omnitrophica bacterium]|nr:tetratricopeptide repeat protein [Candidatus Omnitrophota bacterium]